MIFEVFQGIWEFFLREGLFTLSPHFVILSLRIFGRVKQSGTRKVRGGRYSARTPNNPR